MAAKKLINVDWKAIEAQTVSSKRSTGMVDTIREACKEILSDGEAYEVRKLQQMIQTALNEDVPEEEKVAVNWITVKYTLTHAGGFREAEHNVFVMDSSVKKPAKKGRK
jgi:hypothetical protein